MKKQQNMQSGQDSKKRKVLKKSINISKHLLDTFG